MTKIALGKKKTYIITRMNSSKEEGYLSTMTKACIMWSRNLDRWLEGANLYRRYKRRRKREKRGLR